MPSLTVSPARAVAFAVVERVFEQDAWADRALVGEARRAGLDPRDRALATQLAFGTIQRRATLDHLIGVLAGRDPARLDPPVRAALRLGLFQLAYLDRVPDHAVVAEAVELAKAESPRGAGLVNAVLRRGAREARGVVAALPEGRPAEAALKHSHPEWIARLWWKQLGPRDARALMAAGNRPPEPVLRANALRTTRDALAAAHSGWPCGSNGASSTSASGRPGERVLDLCSAPGGKATHLAALMEGRGRVVAVERDATRAKHLRATVERLGAGCVEVRQADAAALAEPPVYDRVLVDPPCSDLGTLALRPDARWRKRPQDPERLSRLQRAVLDAGALTLRPGGTLVYSTCTISPRENEELLAAFLADRSDFTVEAPPRPSDLPVWDHPGVARVEQTLPHRDGTDGFFIARLRREP